MDSLNNPQSTTMIAVAMRFMCTLGDNSDTLVQLCGEVNNKVAHLYGNVTANARIPSNAEDRDAHLVVDLQIRFPIGYGGAETETARLIQAYKAAVRDHYFNCLSIEASSRSWLKQPALENAANDLGLAVNWKITPPPREYRDDE